MLRSAPSLIVALALLVFSSSACFIYDPVNALPERDIASVLDEGGPPEDKKVLVLAGDSITQGTVGYRWAEDVATLLGDDWFVVNAGTNGQIAWEVAERTDQIIDCDPDVVVVLIGTNDAMAEYDPEFGQQAVDDRDLPQLPDQAFYREQLTRISTTLRDETEAHVALMSIPTLGENWNDPVWDLSKAYAAIARDVASATNVTYAPLFENMDREIGGLAPRETPATEEWLSLMGGGIFLHQTGQTWDEIGESRGFYLHTDHLHLDEDGGALVTDTVVDVVGDLTTARPAGDDA